MRLIVALAARPNVIKAAPLIPELSRAGIDVDVAFSGARQSVRPESAIGPVSYCGVEMPAPKWFLDTAIGSDASRVGRAIVEYERLFETERPDAVLIVGDVSSSLAAAISAAKAGLPVVHLEAGSRCGDLAYPEEVNRVLISRIAAMHLTSTEEALENLEDEGVEPERIHFVGSMLAESVLKHMDAIKRVDAAGSHEFIKNGYVLAMFHRSENLESHIRLQAIMAGLTRSPLPVLFSDADALRDALGTSGIQVPENARFLEGVDYRTMLALERDAAAICTDSGGLQQESCVVGTACVVVRPCSEHTPTVVAGAAKLAAANSVAIEEALFAAIEAGRDWVVPKRWDTAVSGRIVRALKRGIIPLH